MSAPRVLLVDDSHTVTQTLIGLLEEHGFEVLTGLEQLTEKERLELGGPTFDKTEMLKAIPKSVALHRRFETSNQSAFLASRGRFYGASRSRP